MDIQTNEIEYCKVLVNYKADREDIDKKRAFIVSALKRDATVPGFRKGQADTIAINAHFRKEIAQKVKEEMTQEAVQQAISEKNLKPFGNPTLNKSDLQDDHFECEFVLNTKPNFELKQYKTFDIPKYSYGVSIEEMTQKSFQELRVKMGINTPFNATDVVQLNDKVVINLSSFIDGEENPIVDKGEVITVGQTPVPGFDDNLIGLKVGETKEINTTVPKESPSPFAGKNVKFSVEIVEGNKVQPLPLNDELAKALGIETFDKLSEQIRITAANRIQELTKEYNNHQISQRLIENHSFEVPQWVAIAEAQMIAKNNKVIWDVLSDEDRTKLIKQAKNNVKLSLLLEAIRENEPNSQLTVEETMNTIKQNLSMYSQDPEKVMQEVIKNGHLFLLINRVKDDFVLEFIEKTCNFVE